MRVTNKMMTNNMLYNINNNKNAMSKLEMQYATGLKIQKPSEDPIIAVRALKLRTNLSELNQYYERNIPDAYAWMDATESSLEVVNDILTQVHTYCVQGANDPLTEEDRNNIVKTLEELKQQIYQEGNTNYAGRYVFTGFKTDTSLVFNEPTSQYNYKMTECLAGTDIDLIKRPIYSLDINAYNPDDPQASDFTQKPNVIEAYRLRLAYDDLKKEDEDGTIKVTFPTLDEEGKYQYDEDGVLIEEEYSGDIVFMGSTEASAYEPEEGVIHYLTDTGELIIPPDLYNEWSNRPSIHVEYEKNKFFKNDLRPEHYFDCTVTDLSDVNEDDPDGEQEPLVYTKQNQQLQYEINFSQKMTINTQGSDAILHDSGRIIDEMVSAINNVIDTQTKIDETKKMLSDSSLTEQQKAALNEMLGILNTEYTLKTEVMQSCFARGLTEIEKQQNVVSVASADLGSRYVRLQLTESRLSTEQTDFEEMLSNNEDADIVDTVINYNSQETIYNAALSAAAKVVKNTLLDFI